MNKPKAEQTEIEHIYLDKITKTYNPRKTFDKAAQAELEGSIKLHGIQQPLHARRLPDGSLELVCGERRLRAADALKLATVPMIIHDNLSDADADAMRLIENLQREALPPMEEAEGFERLAKTHNLTQQDVADRVGKTKSYVVRRMQLLKLTPKCREALRKGVIDVSGAFALACVNDPASMDEALKEAGYRSNCEQINASEIRWTIKHRISCTLAEAQFDTNATYEGVIQGRTGHGCQLVDVGTCKGCAKRTGNNEDLFGKPNGPDICTDPKCFEAKAEAAWQRVSAEQKAKGNTVLSDANSRNVFEYESSEHPTTRSGLVRVDEALHEDPKRRTWERILGAKFTPPLVIGRNREGKIFRMAKVDDLKKSAKAAGIKLQVVRDSMSGNSNAAEQRKAREKTRIGQIVGIAALGKIAEKAECWLDAAFIRWLTRSVIKFVANDAACAVCTRRLPEEKRDNADAALLKLSETMTEPQLRGLCAELLSVGYGVYSTWGGISRELKASAKFFGVDVKRVDAQVRKELAAKKAKKPAVKKAKKPAATAATEAKQTE